ncbi:hypothetical protein AAKU55_005456 [Oxalobacteraceae bacterium GrIS 1.11]
MKKLLICTLIGFSGFAAAESAQTDRDLPNPAYTPGSTSPAVTQANIHKTICVPGYTATVRPPSSYTSALKARQLASYYKGNCTAATGCEEDHLIALEIGGNPTDEKNLWPEPNAQAKDSCENRLKKDVCSGAMTLKDAQVGISGDWKTFCSAH